MKIGDKVRVKPTTGIYVEDDFSAPSHYINMTGVIVKRYPDASSMYDWLVDLDQGIPIAFADSELEKA